MSAHTTDPTATPAPWPVFMAPLRSRHEVAAGTMASCFDKPAAWTFAAGQFIDLTLVTPPETDAEEDTRGFSIARAPLEDTLMIATRLRDTAFKQTSPHGSGVLPTFDDPVSPFPERQRQLLAVDDDLATMGSGQG